MNNTVTLLLSLLVLAVVGIATGMVAQMVIPVSKNKMNMVYGSVSIVTFLALKFKLLGVLGVKL